MPVALPPQLTQWASRWPALAKLTKKPVASSAFGLDIGSVSVKGVLLTRGLSGTRMERFALAPLPPGAGKPEQVKAIQEVLRKVSPPRDARVVTAVGGGGTVVRAVDFPKMTPAEMRNALTFEAEKHIPFKLEGIYLDSAVLGEKPGGQMEILLAAARKEVVGEQLELLSQAGVSPHSVDIDMLALANAWEAGHPGKEGGVVGLIHIGGRATLLDFVQGDKLRFAREIPVGGTAFTQAVAQGLKVDLAEAERIKCRPGERAQEARTALQPSWDDWLNHCRTSFDFFENQHGVRVERLALSGGASLMAGFKEWVREASGLPAELWSAGAGWEASEGARPGEQEGPALNVAVGLAAREMAA